MSPDEEETATVDETAAGDDTVAATDGGAATEARGGPTREGLQGPRPGERELPAGRRTKQGIRVDPEAEVSHEPRRTVISALVKHEPGVLAKVSGLVSRRQFNIESLTVGPTTNPESARITLVIEEPDPKVRQVEKQLEKLVPVISVRELDRDALRRELVVLKVNAESPEQVHAITKMYDGRTLDAGPKTATIEIAGDEQKIDDAVDAFRQFGIRELARTGQTALARGAEWTTHAEEERYYEMHDETPPVEGTSRPDGGEARADDTPDDTDE